MRDFKRMLQIAIAVGIGSQIHIGLFESEFLVSAGIMFFVILVYHYDVKPVPTGVLSGIVVYILRLIVYGINNTNIDLVVYPYMFEIVFYITYAIIYSILMRKDDNRNIGKVFLVLIVSDFGANLIEITARTMAYHSENILNGQMALLIVGIIRSSIIWFVLFMLDNYRMLLLKKDHEERYRKLLWLFSKLKAEMYWIEKNMDNIEKVMTSSYELYEKINNNVDEETWSDRALNIARDIHEVKKEDGLVVRGIKEITEEELTDQGIKFSDIMNILQETMEREAKLTGNDIEFEFVVGPDFYTKNHYFLMSILRNLVMNSMDALKNEEDNKKISVRHYLKGDEHLFIVEDNGSGMSAKDLKRIFSAGYSTKINYNTGEINRGLGLSIVQNITEERLKGKLEVKSTLKVGTKFNIFIPWKELEEIDENFYSR